MVFRSRQLTEKLPDFKITVMGKELTPASFAKDLGVTHDPNLSFETHILKNVSSCMLSLGWISRIKHAFNGDLLLIIINALVFSKLFYCSSVWPSTSGKNIAKLKLV